MGNMDDIRGGEAEFREPSPPESVIMGGEVEHRRPGPPGASPEEEARHETPRLWESPDLCVRLASAGRTPRQGPDSRSAAPDPPDEDPSFRRGRTDAALSPTRRGRARIVAPTRLTFEEVEAKGEEWQAMMEALRLLAEWICRLPRQNRERKAA